MEPRRQEGNGDPRETRAQTADPPSRRRILWAAMSRAAALPRRTWTADGASYALEAVTAAASALQTQDLARADVLIIDTGGFRDLPERLQLTLAANERRPAVVLIERAPAEGGDDELEPAIRLALEGYDVVTGGERRRLDVAGRIELLKHGLSETEFAALRGLALGYSNRQIGDYLALSEAAVKSVVRTLLHKLGLSNRTQAAVMMARLESTRTRRPRETAR